MSEDESFLTRWSRLKREQAAALAKSDDQTSNTASLPVDAGAGTVDVAAPTVDLASLPPLESIGAGTDMSAYLSAGVPLELVRAALRSAWRTDPAVRDFVEMADNQWDFNALDGIPGFGELGVTEGAQALVARAVTITENTAAGLATLQSSSPRSDSQVATRLVVEESRVIDPVWQSGGAVAGLAQVQQGPVEVAAAEEKPDPEGPAPGRRLHGSALPR